ncbi:MAG: energy transducer TonB [Bacteroidota bacterium]
MIRSTLTLLTLLLTTLGYAQVISTKYYANEWSDKEVSQEKAKFVETVSKDKTGAVTTELRNIKKNTIVSSETYKDEEPYGIWIYQHSKGTDELDYNFPLNYDPLTCEDSIPGVTDYFADNDKLKYRAPYVENGLSIDMFIAKNVLYPVMARENGIEGKIILRFTISEQGNTENVVIVRGSHIVLDKEASRVVRALKFSNPPMLNGKRQNICFTLPIAFQLK